MNAARPNCLVVDFSVLPCRPDPAAAEDFIIKKLNLVMEDAKVIQYHNIDRRFYIQMKDSEKPLLYQRHNLKHTMLCKTNGKEYRIPVYFLDGAATVRLHDLPPTITGTAIRDGMRPYGTVVNVYPERWKNYFGGSYNGVWIVRMHLDKPIPSYLRIGEFQTYCTHSTAGLLAQIKTCFFCNEPLHPNTKCTVKSSSPKQTFSAQDFPALESTSKHIQTHPAQEAQQTPFLPPQHPPLAPPEKKARKTDDQSSILKHASQEQPMQIDNSEAESKDKGPNNNRQSTNKPRDSSRPPSTAGVEIRNFYTALDNEQNLSISN